MQAIIKAMLELQNKLNIRTLGPDWTTAPEADWYLAISQECAEGIDHLGWKWWAQQKENIPAARVEVIDILHFVLSAELAGTVGIPTDVLAARLERSFTDHREPLYLDEVKFETAGLTTTQLFQLTSALATVRRTHFGLIVLLAEKLGLNILDMSVLYRQKATLNLFRQNNGYKDGSYIKQWGPNLEDNDFLTALSDGINWTHASAQDLFYGRLNVKYLEMTQALSKH